MRVAWYERPTGDRPDPRPETLDLSWEALQDLLWDRWHFGPKETAPGWAPHWCETRRKDENVREMSGMVLDLDTATDAMAATFLEALEPFQRLIHTTISHAPGANRLRAVLPLAKPIAPEAWRAVWEAFIDARGLRPLVDLHDADVKAKRKDPRGVDHLKDPARFYYVPSSPDQNAEHLFERLPGALLDLSKYVPEAKPAQAPKAPKPAGKKHAFSPSLTGEVDMDALRACLKGNEWGELLLKGKPLASPGNRHNAIRDAANAVARLCPEDTPQEALEELFVESLSSMGAEDWTDLPLALESARPYWAEKKAERAAEFEHARKRLSLLAKASSKKHAFSQAQAPAPAPTAPMDAPAEPGEKHAFSGDQAPPADPQEPDEKHAFLEALQAQVNPEVLDSEGRYTQDALTRWANEHGGDDAFRSRWIISKDRAYYLFFFGQYQRPVSAEDAGARMEVVFAPAPLRLFNEKEVQGLTIRTPRKVEDLRREYGTVPLKTHGSLVAQKSYYDPAEDTFVEALCPLRDISPKEHTNVGKWLELLTGGGDAHEKLLDWMATVTELGRPTSALYVWGRKGCGKNTLVRGIARLWTKTGAPCPMEAFVSGFNSLIAECPIIFADEDFPPEAKNVTALIRRTLGQDTFRLSRKFLPDVMVEGYPRLCVAANDPGLLENLREDMTQATVEAVAERVRILRARDEAAEYLLTLGPKETATWAYTGDKIAEHCLWLKASRKVSRDGRFLVPGEMTDAVAALSISGFPGALLQFLGLAFTKHWKDGKFTHPSLMQQVFPGNGKLLIKAQVFLDERLWEDFVGQEWRKSPVKIGKALREHLALEELEDRMHSIKWDLLLLWMRRNGVGDVEDVRLAVTRNVMGEGESKE